MVMGLWVSWLWWWIQESTQVMDLYRTKRTQESKSNWGSEKDWWVVSVAMVFHLWYHLIVLENVAMRRNWISPHWVPLHYFSQPFIHWKNSLNLPFWGRSARKTLSIWIALNGIVKFCLLFAKYLYPHIQACQLGRSQQWEWDEIRTCISRIFGSKGLITLSSPHTSRWWGQ